MKSLFVCMQILPFLGWTLSELTMAKVTDEILLVWRVRVYLFIDGLGMIVGCDVVTLDSCGSVGGCLFFKIC